jgi:hypothetical protein
VKINSRQAHLRVLQNHEARTICVVVAALAAALCLVGCATPLGPGFRIEHQELSAEYVPGPQPAMRVRAAWRIAPRSKDWPPRAILAAAVMCGTIAGSDRRNA